MVSKKRLHYGFNGYCSPVIPRAPRSIRRRGPRKSSVEDNKLCAFELLATVADKLLQESESSASSNVVEGKVLLSICQDVTEKQNFIDNKAVKSESLDHGSCAESAFVAESSVLQCNISSSSKEELQAENNSILEQTSLISSSNVLKKAGCDVKLGTLDVVNGGASTSSKLEHLNSVGDSFYSKLHGGLEVHSADDQNKLGDSSVDNKSTVKNLIGEYVNTNTLVTLDSGVQLPVYKDTVPNALMQKHWNNVRLEIRDDDENSFRCNKYSTKSRPFRPQQHIGYRRIRNMLTSRCRKLAPKLKGWELYNTSERTKSFYQYRKRIYTRERYQHVPIKKRKVSDNSFAVQYNRDTSWMYKSNSASIERESGSSDTTKGDQTARGRHVKFSIKSFKVPELYIEVPENASVGSLKRTVMEAVTAILGSGIRVGIVLQGKKVRDDNRTLHQAGISRSSNLDSLGFILEPSFANVSSSTTTKKLLTVLPCNGDQELTMSPATQTMDSGISNASIDHPPPMTKFEEDVNNKKLLASQDPAKLVKDEGFPDSKALVPVPSMDADALIVVPWNPKSKRNEVSQRRTRRPFSVAEVEALVGAVEKLGTGRWRDVKLGAFENADHRTYVDLKDKWKTLVHTASISLQQRRGEPVPQELLDRVLYAHSYWSQQNPSKQQRKLPVEPLKTVVNGREEAVGASNP